MKARRAFALIGMALFFASVAIAQPPAIASQPQFVTVVVGQSATVFVVATGTSAADLSVAEQWSCLRRSDQRGRSSRGAAPVFFEFILEKP